MRSRDSAVSQIAAAPAPAAARNARRETSVMRHEPELGLGEYYEAGSAAQRGSRGVSVVSSFLSTFPGASAGLSRAFACGVRIMTKRGTRVRARWPRWLVPRWTPHVCRLRILLNLLTKTRNSL